MAGRLTIVATPIGHLDDISLRALKLLREAHVIAAEDTRRTRNLLNHFGIDTPTISFHEHNTRSRVPALLTRLQAGESVVVVSDAGTPLICDPGLELVQRCIDHGIAVDAVPGASAPLALGVVSGFPLTPWTLHGFAPIGSNARTKWFQALLATPHTVSFFEAPHRIRRTLSELGSISGNRPIVVGRELTKMHQTIYRGIGSALAAAVEPLGEFTIMLGPELHSGDESHDIPSDSDIRLLFGQMTDRDGLGRRAALKALATKYGLSTKFVFDALERTKSS